VHRYEVGFQNHVSEEARCCCSPATVKDRSPIAVQVFGISHVVRLDDQLNDDAYIK